MKPPLACSVAVLALAACGQRGGAASTSATGAPATSRAASSRAADTIEVEQYIPPRSPAPATPGSAVAAADAPHQRAGVWRVVTEAGGQTETSSSCVTPAESARGLDPNQFGGEGCSQRSLTREGDAYVARATCGGATVQIRITGDMQSTMRLETNMNLPGQASQRMISTATYTGQASCTDE